MNNSALWWLKVMMWGAGVFHLCVGLSLNLDIGLKEWVGGSLYGARVDWSDAQFVYILRPLGAFMFALGVMALLAARDPIRNKAVVLGFGMLFVLRGLQRILFFGTISDTFTIATSRSMGAMVIMFGMAAALLLLLRAAQSEGANRPAAHA